MLVTATHKRRRRGRLTDLKPPRFGSCRLPLLVDGDRAEMHVATTRGNPLYRTQERGKAMLVSGREARIGMFPPERQGSHVVAGP